MTGRLPGLALSRATIDRAGELRGDEAFLDRMWSSRERRLLRTSQGKAAVVPGSDPPALALDGGTELPRDAAAFLGVDGTTPYFAVEVDEPDDTFRGLREIGVLLDDRDAGLMVAGVALANWHRTHQHCPRCGAPTRVTTAGWTRTCTEDGSEHYPRTDPAVIMTVVDDDDRLLLGSQVAWPSGRFSTLAGFVEPGESLEQAVRREVHEEVGVDVGEVTYLGSQPWPFPSSLMLGFRADALSTDVDLRDGEIAQARWFSRAELVEAVRGGDVRLSPPLSIARRLIEHWYGEPLTDAGDVWR